MSHYRQVKEYKVIHYSWSSTRYFSVWIYLYDQDGKKKGEVRFHKEQHNPADIYDSDHDKIIIHFPLHRYPEIIDFLRNEKPLTLAFNPNTNEGRIYSGKEPIGEEET